MKKSIFREYDIRGVVDRDLTPEVVRDIGQAVGSLAAERGETEVIVGRDGRLSSPALCEALKAGIRAAGLDVLDLGAVSTPLLYYATHTLDSSHAGVMVTGSHNPPQYNGLKIVIDKIALHGEVIRDLRRRIETGDLHHGRGGERSAHIRIDYHSPAQRGPAAIQTVQGGGGLRQRHRRPHRPASAAIAGLRGGGTVLRSGRAVSEPSPRPQRPREFGRLAGGGARTPSRYRPGFRRRCRPAGRGDRHGRNRLARSRADAAGRGSAGPSSRCGRGVRYQVLLASDPADRAAGRPADFVEDRPFADQGQDARNRRVAGRRDDRSLRPCRRLVRLRRCLLRRRAAAAAAGPARRFQRRIFRRLSDRPQHPGTAAGHGRRRAVRVHGPVADQADFGTDARIIALDGLRVEFPHGWGLVRASNTTPSLTLRFEADDPAAMTDIQDRFRRQLLASRADLALPF